MRILITESQERLIIGELINEQEDLCLRDFVEFVNANLEDLINLTDDEIFSVYENLSEIQKEVQDPKLKKIFRKFLENVETMDYSNVKSELKNLLNLKNSLKEQQTPYLEQTFTIANTEIPKYAIHTLLGLMIITLLSKLINLLSQKKDSIKPKRRSVSKSVVGCQAARGRAKAIQKRRRRENWRSFLRKIGLR